MSIRRIAINLFLLGMVTLHSAAGTELGFRPADRYQWNNASNWLTGADTIANRTPASDPNDRLVIDKNLPAGNILLESMNNDTVYLKNEMRNTAGWWFYWAFRAKGAAGRTLTFRFTNGEAICTHGPCISLDQGKTWTYAADSFTTREFTYTFPTNSDEVWFAMGIIYTQPDWEAFLAKHAARGALIETGTLCQSRHGRAVEKARFGCINKPPVYRVWLSARHHSAEMMASYVLEGILDAVLADNELGGWMRDNVEFMVVPFVDKDGVEEGDQGKNRKPHDHNRDYDAFLYPETMGITNWITTHTQGAWISCSIFTVHGFAAHITSGCIRSTPRISRTPLRRGAWVRFCKAASVVQWITRWPMTCRSARAGTRLETTALGAALQSGRWIVCQATGSAQPLRCHLPQPTAQLLRGKRAASSVKTPLQPSSRSCWKQVKKTSKLLVVYDRS